MHKKTKKLYCKACNGKVRPPTDSELIYIIDWLLYEHPMVHTSQKGKCDFMVVSNGLVKVKK